MRTMLTQSLAVLMPFNVQELNDEGGNYYGINQISKNVNVGNRKKLINGNGFIFGVPGSGKSFFAKQEMGNVFLGTNDDVIVVDPMNEYFDIAATYGGTVVNLSAYTKNYLNPLEADLAHMNEKGIRDVIADKSEFMLGLCDQLLGSALNQNHHSIIDRCIRDLYMEAWKSKQVPVMTDFYHILKKQTEAEAQELALCLELFVEGSLNIFNHYTNVDVDNRFTVYGMNMEQAKAEFEKPFAHEKELKEKLKRQSEINALLNVDSEEEKQDVLEPEPELERDSRELSH